MDSTRRPPSAVAPSSYSGRCPGTSRTATGFPRPPLCLLVGPQVVRAHWSTPAYYAALAAHDLGHTQAWDIVSLAIVASVIAHGITATPLPRLYARSSVRQ